MQESLKARMGMDTTSFSRDMSKAEGIVAKSSKRISSIMGAAFAGVGLTSLVSKIVKLGTSAEETASKFNSVFGGSAERVNAIIEKLKTTIPATSSELRAMTAEIQDLLVPLGIAPDAAEKLTVEIVKLAGDLASFNNIPMAEAMEKIRAGLVGSYEPLLSFGVALNASTVKAEAFAMGIGDGSRELNAGERALVTYALILKSTTAAQGDAEKTAGSAANQIKFLMAQLRETGEEIGTNTLPAVLSLVKVMGMLVSVSKEYLELSAQGLGTLISRDPKKIDDEGLQKLAGEQIRRESPGITDANRLNDEVQKRFFFLKSLQRRGLPLVAPDQLKDALDKLSKMGKGGKEAADDLADTLGNPDANGSNDFVKSYNDAYNEIFKIWNQARTQVAGVGDEAANSIEKVAKAKENASEATEKQEPKGDKSEEPVNTKRVTPVRNLKGEITNFDQLSEEQKQEMGGSRYGHSFSDPRVSDAISRRDASGMTQSEEFEAKHQAFNKSFDDKHEAFQKKFDPDWGTRFPEMLRKPSGNPASQNPNTDTLLETIVNRLDTLMGK